MENATPLVRRGRRNAGYTAISNALVDHPCLGPEARIALIYLLTKPDDWQLQINDIRRLLGTGGQPCGRNKAYAVIRELKESAYVVAHEELRRGRFHRLTYYVFDEPVADPEEFCRGVHRDLHAVKGLQEVLPSPCAQIGETVADAPCAQKRDTENGHFTKERKKQITESPPPSPHVLDSDEEGSANEKMFAILWDGWPQHQRPNSRHLARTLFERLSPEDQASAVAAAALHRKAQQYRHQFAAMIPYLRDRLFEDFGPEGPDRTPDGYFRITRDRPEWDCWRADLCQKVSEANWRKQEVLGVLLTRTRWPVGGAGEQPRQLRGSD